MAMSRSNLPRPPQTYLERDETTPCAEDPDAWFPDGHNVHVVKDLLVACLECPIYGPCLEWALHVREDGIWAGTTPTQRKRMRRERGIVAMNPVTLLPRGPMGPDA